MTAPRPLFQPHYRAEGVTLWLGDCLDALATFTASSVDAIVTDPPYGLGFMGKAWDALPPGKEWAEQCLRVLKPGGHLLAFGGTRTWHRLAVAVEDAGFEIRDSIAWLYGSGFPKSLDVSKAIDKALCSLHEIARCTICTTTAYGEREIVGESARHVGKNTQRLEGLNGSSTFAETPGMGSMLTAPATDAAKQWQGWGTALKPAFEPVVVARKPLEGTVAANVQAHGVGALNIDACRIGTTSDLQRPERRGKGDAGGWAAYTQEPGRYGTPDGSGRWPANVTLDPSQAEVLDQQSGTSGSGSGRIKQSGARSPREAPIYGAANTTRNAPDDYGDTGGASRFFYVAKAPSKERPKVDGVAHPTVKPLALMRWLVRLVTPPGGVVLDPFLGSGTTGEACIHEHFQFVGIERDAAYLDLAIARVFKPIQVGFNFEGEAS